MHWVFDLSLIALIIYAVSDSGIRSSCWSFISRYTEKLAGQEQPPAKRLIKTPVALKSPAAINFEDETAAPPPPAFIPPPLPTEEQLSSQVPGDCFPPEARSSDDADAPAIARLFYQPPPLPKSIKVRQGQGKPVQFAKKKVKGVPFYQVTVDLNDPDTYLVIRLPKKAKEANSTTYSVGHDNFDTFVKRYPAAVIVNGTFFSKDEQERVMGNMVSEGKSLKFSPWENYGTTLALREGDYPEMVTARAEGKPNWQEHWFSLTCGPRLLKEGRIWLNPKLEGFADPHVLGVGPRSAIGFPKSRDKIYLITFLQGLSLEQEAKLMKEIGCYEAMNLDGGASKALSQNGKVVMSPGRGLTNVLVVYDSLHKAPAEVISSWRGFQTGQNDKQIISSTLSR